MLKVVFFDTAPSGIINLTFPSEETKLPPSLPIFISVFSPSGFPIAVMADLAVVSSTALFCADTVTETNKKIKTIIFFITFFLLCLLLSHRVFIGTQSQFTVDSHRKNLLAKLNVKNTAMLIKLAVENKLL